ncbi:MAG TPA: 4-(cytidine 5'-diphospho)-2-C-methyl-D-erythritol kinase [Burkholderiales bacterium]|nr:4-(cytidine 5'-diphospho)-2-C-methyl-D-erythritol kinase [Burkholderiales bacterium]
MTARRADRSLTCPAPAKLNLFLVITGRRADGYHLLQTAFRFIDRADELTFRLRTDGRVRRVAGLVDVAESDDLTVRAARLLQSESGCGLGVDIAVGKHVPVGGGLGGGSSDAATTLIALNRLWDLRLRRAKLQELALSLGADVPVFVFGRNALAEGIGEVLHAIEVGPAWYLVLVPPVAVSTAAVFADPQLTRPTTPVTIRAFSEGCDPSGLFGRNDLEPVVCRRYPEVAQHLAWLRRFGPAALTGSGACVYRAFDSEAPARSVLAQLPAGMHGFVAQGLSHHPLLDWME